MKADAQKVLPLLKTARGQLDKIIQMAQDDAYCLDISHQLLACEGLLKKINREVLGAHIESCVRDAFESGTQQEKNEKVNELVELIGRMSK